jgi:nucleoside-diphosphate-sugar epimerase
MKTILITGRAGFVGSHACKALSRAGYVLVTFERPKGRPDRWQHYLDSGFTRSGGTRNVE